MHYFIHLYENKDILGLVVLQKNGYRERKLVNKSNLRYGKRLVQAWVPEELISKALKISGKSNSEILIESLTHYINQNKSELELAQERYESLILEATRTKAKIDELTKINLKEYKKELDNAIVPKNKDKERQLSEKEKQDLWEFKIWPHVKKKISEAGFDNVIMDERMLDNFSKGLCISTPELKEKIRINAGVV